MKTKVLLLILGGAFTLLLYNILCYWCVNMMIDNSTRFVISEYFKNKYVVNDFSYEYKSAINNSDGTISVFIKTEDDKNDGFYRIILNIYVNIYKVVSDNNDIPSYVKFIK